MNVFGITDRGVERETNQDCIYLDNVAGFYMVADGMGGHAMGEVASKKAVSTVTAVIQKNITSHDAESLKHDEPVLNIIKEAVHAANQEIYEYSRGETMGTTLSFAYFSNGKVYIAHIGDSRIYRLRGRALEKLTVDHTEAESLVKAGILDPDRAENHYSSHVLTRALGSSKSATIDFETCKVRGGDVYLLSSDGLFRVVNVDEVIEVLLKDCGPEKKCSILVESALTRGAPDNVSVIVVEVPRLLNKMFSGIQRRFVRGHVHGA
jgi:serine/threonine protein phosphatase PrpC